MLLVCECDAFTISILGEQSSVGFVHTADAFTPQLGSVANIEY
jgi:hypothetical protein